MRAFEDLQRQVLAEGGHTGDWDSLDELAEAKEDAEFWDEGTHSILDMNGVAGHGDFATVSPVPHEEIVALFGSATPSRADFERVQHTDWSLSFDRWHGRYTALYNDGVPHELAFWGYSGD